MTTSKSIEETIKDEAEKLYPTNKTHFPIHISNIDLAKKNREAYIAGRSQNLAKYREALEELELYFENRADVDFIGESRVPNEEAKILTRIRQLLNP